MAAAKKTKFLDIQLDRTTKLKHLPEADELTPNDTHTKARQPSKVVNFECQMSMSNLKRTTTISSYQIIQNYAQEQLPIVLLEVINWRRTGNDIYNL